MGGGFTKGPGVFTNPSEKTCTTCGETKPADEFYRSRYSRDGRMASCAACQKQRTRAYRERLRRRNRALTPDLDAARRCPACKQTKTGHDFYRNPSATGGLHWVCKTCVARPTPRRKPSTAVGFAGYEADTEELQALFESQQGACAICRTPFGEDAPNVDHDHASGAVRGLLCAPCNPGLGAFGEDIAVMERAARYLRLHEGDK